MKTFVINMKKDVRRKRDMQKQFKKFNVDVEFFEGINGKKIKKEHFSQIADKEKLEAKEKRPLDELKGMVGCTYSHFLIYQKMMNERIEVACILEDDVILSKEFKKQIDWVENQIKKNEIISLHTLLYDPVNFEATGRTNDTCNICNPTPPKIRGTQGYVITLYCAKQLMTEMIPIKEFPDCFNRYQLFCPDVQIRVLFPFIIRHMWIDSVRDDKKYGLKDHLLNLIQRYRIFPFWNMIRIRRRKLNDQHIGSFISQSNSPITRMYVEDICQLDIFSKL
ncbi:MAG: glycosyltransferase family 25 protein [Reichenbachiella sp.]